MPLSLLQLPKHANKAYVVIVFTSAVSNKINYITAEMNPIYPVFSSSIQKNSPPLAMKTTLVLVNFSNETNP